MSAIFQNQEYCVKTIANVSDRNTQIRNHCRSNRDAHWNFLVVVFISKNMTRTKYVDNFYNVISPTGADPWVYQHTDGWYYMTRTTGGYVRIWRSRTFTSFGASESKTIWTSPNTGPACRDVWAPEIHYIKSAW